MSPNSAELYELSEVIEKGLRAPLEGISENTLNYALAPHKMSIGQLAVHCMGWAQYFLAESKWDPVKWTCVEVNYPLKLEQVYSVLDKGFERIREVLIKSTDETLELTETGKKGPGYIIYRLLIHAMTHANQMAYLRQAVDPQWEFGGHFGDMASAIIATNYSTSRDTKIRGF